MVRHCRAIGDPNIIYNVWLVSGSPVDVVPFVDKMSTQTFLVRGKWIDQKGTRLSTQIFWHDPTSLFGSRLSCQSIPIFVVILGEEFKVLAHSWLTIPCRSLKPKWLYWISVPKSYTLYDVIVFHSFSFLLVVSLIN